MIQNHGSPRSAAALVEINGQMYDLYSRTYIMGIINLTPDSFSGDGVYSKTNYIDEALKQAERMIAEGADFLDVGAESTRPKAARVSEAEEERRLLPVVKELVTASKVPVSIDTYKPGVAEKALNMGASIINDIWGLKAPDDPESRMARVVAEARVPVIIMHNKTEPVYGNIMDEIAASLADSIRIAAESGLPAERVIIDPGIGFGKTYRDNLAVLRRLDELQSLGRPLLLGTSRKSVVGLALDSPVTERLEGTIATCVWGISKGANILRVHDVKEVSRAARMCDAIRGESGAQSR
jgi:dihydropteroate synthase